MAFSRKNKSVVETNHVSAVRTGNIKAQYPCVEPEMQNGMAIFADDVAKEMRFPTATDEVVYLHASEEKLYESHLGRNSFSIKEGQYPKALKLELGDIFETNALLAGEDVTYAAGEVVAPGLDGFWAKGLTTPLVEATIVEMVSLPNGELGAKLAITKIGA